MANKKACNSCNKVKSVRWYDKDARTTDGYKHTCRTCLAIGLEANVQEEVIKLSPKQQEIIDYIYVNLGVLFSGTTYKDAYAFISEFTELSKQKRVEYLQIKARQTEIFKKRQSV